MQRRLLKRALGRTVLFVLAFVAGAEILSLGLFPLLTGRGFNYRRIRQERVATINQLCKQPDRGGTNACCPGVAYHPFLGYAPTDRAADPAWFAGVDSTTGSDDKWVVGILGGSVAYRFCVSPAFEKALASSAAFKGRDIVLVPLAFEGYRQPQQLNALILALLAGKHFDVVVSLDGLNEAAMGIKNERFGVSCIMPDCHMMHRLRELNSPQLTWRVVQVLHKVLVCRRRALAVLETVERWPLRYSPACSLVALILSESFDRQARTIEASWAQSAAASATAGDDLQRKTVEEEAKVAEIAEYWATCIRLVHAICDEYGIPYIACLQPSLVLAGSKPMSRDEESLLPESDPVVEETLLQIRQAASECREKGVTVLDLTDLFKETEETVYTDFCHLNERGQSIVAHRIGEEILKKWP